jgi:hypothetical protein
MSNRRDRRRAASVRKHAKKMSPADKRNLILWIGVAVLAALAGAALLSLVR